MDLDRKNKHTNLEDRLKNRDIRPTAMRILVLKYFIEESNCASLNELELQLDTADKSTLFRTLTTFEQNGLIHKIEDGTGVSKYGLCVENCDCSTEFQHYHFHCMNCNETFCMDALRPKHFDLPKGFQVKSANLVLQGLCSNCN